MKIDTKTLKNIAIIAGGVLAFLVLRKYLKKWGLIGKQQEDNTSELYELLAEDESGKIQGSATITNTEAKKLASQIKSAWGVMNDDEESVYSAFNRLRSLADLLLLIDAYGINKPNFLTPGRDLVDDIRSRMGKKEIEKINKILESKGINYTI